MTRKGENSLASIHSLICTTVLSAFPACRQHTLCWRSLEKEALRVLEPTRSIDYHQRSHCLETAVSGANARSSDMTGRQHLQCTALNLNEGYTSNSVDYSPLDHDDIMLLC